MLKDVFLVTFGADVSMFMICGAMILVFFIIIMMDLIKGRW